MKDDRPYTYFALLRHAETEWNREKRIQGQRDAALTSYGREQAEQWGRALGKHELDHMVSSDLGRATDTADIINQSLGLSRSLVVGLREQDWGEWTGFKQNGLNQDALKEQEARGWHFCPPNGESRLDVLERSRQAVVDIAQKWKRSRILVVTHGGVIRCLLYDLSRREFLPQEPPLLEPYCLHWLVYDGKGLHIQQLNERI